MSFQQQGREPTTSSCSEQPHQGEESWDIEPEDSPQSPAMSEQGNINETQYQRFYGVGPACFDFVLKQPPCTDLSAAHNRGLNGDWPGTTIGYLVKRKTLGYGVRVRKDTIASNPSTYGTIPQGMQHRRWFFVPDNPSQQSGYDQTTERGAMALPQAMQKQQKQHQYQQQQKSQPHPGVQQQQPQSGMQPGQKGGSPAPFVQQGAGVEGSSGSVTGDAKTTL